MRKLYALAAFCLSLLAPNAYGQNTATITGNISDPTNTAVTSRTVLNVELKNTNGQVCKVAGVALVSPYVQQFTPQQLVAGFSLLKNSVIVCGTTTGQSQWVFTIVRDGKPQSGCALQITANTNLNSAACLNAAPTPVTVTPTDSVYCRLDASNCGFTGTITHAGNNDTGIGTLGAVTATISGNETVGGTLGVTGAETTQSLNNVQTINSLTTGSDMAAKIATAIAASPSTGGIVDARFFQGNQAWASNPFSGVTIPITLILGQVTVQSSVPLPIASDNIQIWGSGINQTILQYAGGATATFVKFGTATPSVTFLQRVGMRDMTIKGSANVTDTLFLTGVHRSDFERLALKDATGACLHTQFAVVLTLVHVTCTSNDGVSFVQQPANGMLFDQISASFPTTASTIVDPIIEGVTGSGIKLTGANGLIFTGGTSEGNGGRGIEVTNVATNNHNTFAGTDLEANTTEDVLDNGAEDSYDNLISTGLVHFGANSLQPRIQGGNLNSITIDAGAKNAVVDTTWNLAGSGVITENGTNTRARLVNRQTNVPTCIPWCWRDSTPVVSILDSQDSMGFAATFTTSPTVLSNTVLTASTKWRVVFLGMFLNNVEGTTLAQPPPYTEATTASPTIVIGSVTLTISLNGSSQLSAITGANQLVFSGHIFVFSNSSSTTAGTSSQNLKGTVSTPALISNGTAAALTGTGACATITTQSGGASAGTAKCTGTTGASTLTITPGFTAPNGWTCYVQDETTRGNLFQQTGHGATSCTLTVTSVTQNDVFVFSAMAF